MVKLKFFSYEFVGINEEINHLLLLQNGRIAITTNNKLLIYSMITMKVELTIAFILRITAIYKLANGLLLIKAYGDEFIQIVLIMKDSYKVMHKIEFSYDIHQFLEISNDRFVISKLYGKINIYNGIPPYNKLKSINIGYGLNQSMIYVKEKNCLFVSIKNNYPFPEHIQVWNLNSYSCETRIQIKACLFPLSMKLIVKNRLIFGGNNEIVLIDLNNYKMYKEEIQGSVLSIIELRDTEIVFVKRDQKAQCSTLIKYNYNHHQFDTLYTYPKANYSSTIDNEPLFVIDKKSFLYGNDFLIKWTY